MTVTVVVGAQWGDEAKGKFVDVLGQNADIVARFNGGDNAGHTVVNQYGTFKVRLTPNGFSNPKTNCVIGPGVVVNLATLIEEIASIESRGIELTGRLWVSPRCNVVMPYHPMMEEIFEKAKGKAKTGTTRRGMGPVYADKVSYNGIRLADMFDMTVFAEKLAVQLALKNPVFKAFGMEPLDFDTVLGEKLKQFGKVKPVVREYFGLLQDALANDAGIVMEGAQGALLDNTWGTYPYCTASTPLSGGAAAGAGIPPAAIDQVLGIAKAYTTRVGGGPMPTELFDEDGEALRQAGAEFGTVTGRPRLCGWFDADLVRFTAQLNGFTALALTKLDVLDQLPVVKICTGYRVADDSDEHHYWEGDARWLASVEPVYLEMEGWMASTQEVRDFKDLPHQAQAYVRKIEELVGVPVRYVSVGPQREAVIEV